MSRALLSIMLIALLGLLSILVAPGSSVAADLDTESMSLSDPTIDETGVTYTITQSNVTTSTIQCIRVEFDTAADGSGGLPSGMSLASVALSGTSNYVPTPASWTATDAGSGVVEITFATGEIPASSSNRTIVLSGIENGDTANTTYFAIVSTYNNVDCSTSPVDSNGQSAFVFTEGVVVTAQVNPTLTFTVDSTTCDLGVLTASTTGSCIHTMTAATNGTGGYTISYIPTTTLTNGSSDTITETGATGATSSQGSEQFGLNLVDNTTPNVGANPSGGSGAASTNYTTADTFSFTASGAQVAQASGPSALTTFTVAYIANIATNTEAGDYQMTQTYNIVAQY